MSTDSRTRMFFLPDRVIGNVLHVMQILVPLLFPDIVVVMRLFTADSFQNSLIFVSDSEKLPLPSWLVERLLVILVPVVHLSFRAHNVAHFLEQNSVVSLHHRQALFFDLQFFKLKTVMTGPLGNCGYLEMHMHVGSWRFIVDLRLDVSHLVSVEIILTLVPALLEQPVVGSRSRLVGAVHFFNWRAFPGFELWSKIILETNQRNLRKLKSWKSNYGIC